MDCLVENYPRLIIIEADEDAQKNRALLQECLEICKSSNIAFIARFMAIKDVVQLLKAGAVQIFDTNDLKEKDSIVLNLKQLAAKRNRLLYNELKEIESESAAHIGSWEFNLIRGTLFWSDITKEIHEVPLDYKPIVDRAIFYYKEGWPR